MLNSSVKDHYNILFGDSLFLGQKCHTDVTDIILTVRPVALEGVLVLVSPN